MTQSDLLYCVEKTSKPTSQLPTCVEEMYTHIGDPQKFRVALVAGERLINIYKHNQEYIKIESLETTVHHFEVWKKDVYEMLRGINMSNPLKCENLHLPLMHTPLKQPKPEVPKQGHHVVTTLLAPPSVEDQAAAGPSAE